MNSNKNIVWYNPNEANFKQDENISFNNFLNDIKQFKNYHEATQFLSKNEKNLWLVITSNTNGEDFVKEIKDFCNISGVLVHSTDKNQKTQWTKSYPKVLGVFYESQVFEELQSIQNTQLVCAVLELNKDDEEIADCLHAYNKIGLNQDVFYTQTSQKAEHFYHKNENMKVKFSLIASLCIKNEAIPPDKVLEELISLNRSEESEIKRVFCEKNQSSLLKAIIYVYSTKIIHRPFNLSCATGDYYKVMYTVAASFIEFKKEADKKDLITLLVSSQKIQVLYRGIDNKLADCYEIGCKFYWPAFTSTTEEIKVAEEFATENGTIFKILLSDANKHPRLKLTDASWSKFPHEKEVVLFPYFAFKVISKGVDKVGRSFITIEQDASENMMSLSTEKLKEYWINMFNEKIKQRFDELFENIEKEIDDAFDIEKYLNKDKIIRCFEVYYQCDNVEPTLNQQIVNILVHGDADFGNMEKMVEKRTKELIDKFVEEVDKKLRQLNELTKKSLIGFIKNDLINFESDSTELRKLLEDIIFFTKCNLSTEKQLKLLYKDPISFLKLSPLTKIKNMAAKVSFTNLENFRSVIHMALNSALNEKSHDIEELSSKYKCDLKVRLTKIKEQVITTISNQF